MKETWITINHGEIINPRWPVANGIYEVSSLGRVRRKKTGNIYAQSNGKIYLCDMWGDKIFYDHKCCYMVSHIMAVEFLDYKDVYGKKLNLDEIIKEVNK